MTRTMEKQFTRGNLISIVATFMTGAALFAGGISAVNSIDAKTIQNAQANTRLEDSFRSFSSRIETRLTDAQTAITSLQVSEARTAAQYDALNRSMDEVKTSLREISTILRQNGGQQP
ncbi:hypothetical protein [Roseovarius sp. MMSF_3350]|uniref:hypothetical protein n=1 Tax=Roseovarius sp. MMSF_3350 TaxID=3046706 RepID=UPI00273D9FE1|nr:hypothetical protein [Roseovarius sp. MMSF_3350]